MAMMGTNNIAAQMALGELNKNSSALRKSLEKISNGMKINSAEDSASNYAISEKMRELIRSLEQDNQNVQNGAALVKVAETGINNIVDELRNLKELAINAANDTNTDGDRATIQKEFDQRKANINDIANLTNYNGIILLDGRWRQLSDDIEMVTLTGTRTVVTGYDIQDTIETVITRTPTLIPDNVSTVISTPYTSIAGYYTEDSPYSYDTVISTPYTSIAGYYTKDSPYSHDTVISAPYTSIVGYYTKDSPYSYDTVISAPYTDITGVSLQPYTESTTVPTISTIYTGSYEKPLTGKTVTEPTAMNGTIFRDSNFEIKSTAFGDYWTWPAIADNSVYEISTNEFGDSHERLVITIPSTVTNVKFKPTKNGGTLYNVFFVVKSPNTNIWFENLELKYTTNQAFGSAIKFGTGNDNALILKRTNTISVDSSNMYSNAVINVGGGLTIQGTGSLKVNVESWRDGAVIGSDSRENSTADITLVNTNITILDNSGGKFYGDSIGAGLNGTIGDIKSNRDIYGISKTVDTVPVTVTMGGNPSFTKPGSTVVTYEGKRTTLNAWETVSSSVPTVISGTRTVDIENITLAGVHTFSADVPTVISGTETVSVPVEETLEGVQIFNPPASTVINGESVTFTRWTTLSTDVPTVISGTETVSVPVGETLEGIQIFDPPASTVINGESVTLTRWATLNSTVESFVPTMRSDVLTSSETVEATINVPIYETETFEYEMQANVLRNPLKIHHEPKANQHLPIYIGDLRTKALGTEKLFSDDSSLSDYERILNERDQERYEALCYDDDLQNAWLETLKLAQNKTLDNISVTTKQNAMLQLEFWTVRLNVRCLRR